MARFLEEEILAGDRFALKTAQHCSTCRCKETTVGASAGSTFHQDSYSIGTQTTFQGSGPNNNNFLCLRCNSNLNSPSRSSPYITGQAMVNGDDEEEPTSRRDDLQVNPILGIPHHQRRHERTMSSTMSEGVSVAKMSQGQESQGHRVDPIGEAKETTTGEVTVEETVTFNNALIKNIKVRRIKCSSLECP